MKKLIYILLAVLLMLSFVSCKKDSPVRAFESVPEEAVDLGFVMTRPNGTTYKLYWSESNLSSDGLCANPEDYGDYYAWGEITPKEDYTWSNYKWGTSNVTPTKYNTLSSYGTVDNKVLLDPEDDVAHVKLGGKWRIPTRREWDKLITECGLKRTTQNGVDGLLILATNGKSIFLPAAAHKFESGIGGDYWSSSSFTTPGQAWFVQFWDHDAIMASMASADRCFGRSIRPVWEE